MKWFTLLLPATFLSISSYALNLNLESKVQKQLNAAILKASPRLKPIQPSKQGEFDQKVDHFAKKHLYKRADETFKQRYWVQSEWASGNDAPVFYVICGEAACDGADSMAAINAVAQKYKGHLVALEHRFYGTSMPKPTLSAKNLKLLSVAQALADLSEFQDYAVETFGLTGKWIAIGGSYSGALSAFYRALYPNQVVGSLASSAPVVAKADYFEYDEHVATVAGPECLANIKAGVKEAEALLAGSADDAQKLKDLFEVKDFKDDRDVLYVLADMGAFAIQYGYHKPFCEGLAKGAANGTILKSYAETGISLLAKFGITPYDTSFVSAEDEDPASAGDHAGMRAWMYQSCTEFGFYQIANEGSDQTARSSKITLQFHNDVCKRLFGLEKQVNTARTNRYYLKSVLSKRATNIYMTNGQNDPWRKLSIENESLNPGLTLFTIEGASHCSDLGSRMTTALSQARAQFSSLVETWLK